MAADSLRPRVNPCEPGRSDVQSSPRRVGPRLEVPSQAVNKCAGPGPRGGVGFTRGPSGSKRAFEFPKLSHELWASASHAWLHIGVLLGLGVLSGRPTRHSKISVQSMLRSPECGLHPVSDRRCQLIRPSTDGLRRDPDLPCSTLDRAAKEMDSFCFLHTSIKACFPAWSKNAFCITFASMKDYFHANVR